MMTQLRINLKTISVNLGPERLRHPRYEMKLTDASPLSHAATCFCKGKGISYL